MPTDPCGNVAAAFGGQHGSRAEDQHDQLSPAQPKGGKPCAKGVGVSKKGIPAQRDIGGKVAPVHPIQGRHEKCEGKAEQHIGAHTLQPHHRKRGLGVRVFGKVFLPDHFGGTQHTADKAPKHIAPGCAVPKAAHQKNDHQIDIMAHLSMAAPPQGNIQIIAEPAGQAHVPAPPEVRKAGSHKGRVEVFQKIEAQNACAANGNIAAARKIHIQLHTKDQNCQQQLRPGAVFGLGKD